MLITIYSSSLKKNILKKLFEETFPNCLYDELIINHKQYINGIKRYYYPKTNQIFGYSIITNKWLEYNS
jgi:hypothetical protein